MGPSTPSAVLQILAWDVNERRERGVAGACCSAAASAPLPICLFSLALNTPLLVIFPFLPSESSHLPDGGKSSPTGVSPLHPDKRAAALHQVGLFVSGSSPFVNLLEDFPLFYRICKGIAGGTYM